MTSSNLGEMTVNERLVATGLLEEWDRAVHARDRETMLQIVRQIEVIPPEPTVDAVLADPAKYGFYVWGVRSPQP